MIINIIIMSTDDKEPAPAPARDRRATRRRLLEAAADVIAREGLAGASLMDIARTARVTTGAIYSSFRGKADLLTAVVDELTPKLRDDNPATAPPAGTASIAELARRAAQFSTTPEARRVLQLQAELLSHAFRHPEVLAIYQHENRNPTAAVTPLLREELQRPPGERRTPLRNEADAALAVVAVIQGLEQHQIVGTQQVPPELFEWAVEALVTAARETLA